MRTLVWERGHNVLGLKHIQDIFKSETEKLSYLTFEALEDLTITFTSASEVNNVLSWSYDGNTWVEGNEVQVKAGDKIMCKGSCQSVDGVTASYTYYYIGWFNTTGYFNLSGNIYSLINFYKFPEFIEEDYLKFMISSLPTCITLLSGESGSKVIQERYPNLSGKELYIEVLKDFPDINEIVNRMSFYGGLFAKANYTKLLVLDKLILAGFPVKNLSWEEAITFMINTTLEEVQGLSEKDLNREFLEFYFYTVSMQAPLGFGSLFAHTKVISASELFLGTVAFKALCNSMFYSCDSLIYTPKLPAKLVGGGCYQQMFQDCLNLTISPELPATTLEEYCYYGMFSGCSNLNNITMLATDISAVNCLDNWTEGVSEKGTFIKSPNMNSLPTGVNGIPKGWTVINI